jgi:molecular chaperone DnaK
MVKDAEAHAAEDKTRRELIDARNQADSLAYQVEKTVNENRDRLPAGDVSRIETAIAALREAATQDDLDAIRRASDELQQASHAMAEQLYRNTQANAANANAASPQTHGGDDVKEGEVVDA